MSLIAHQHAVTMCPRYPLAGEIVEKHVGECLAIVTDHLRVTINQLVDILLEGIAATFLNLRRQGRCPVGTIHLVRVVEDGMRPRCAALAEGLVELVKIMLYRIAVEMVDDISLTTRGSTLDLLTGAADIEGYDAKHILLVGRIALNEVKLGKLLFFLRNDEIHAFLEVGSRNDGIDYQRLAGSLLNSVVGPPNGQPVPLFISISMPRRLPSSST